MADSKRGVVATAAIIALLVAVVGIGIANYYVYSGRVVTETSTYSTTASQSQQIVQAKTTTTKTSTVTVNEATTQFSSATITSVVTSTTVSTPSTTVTIMKTSGNITLITTAEAVLYGGNSATPGSAATASLFIGFYNPNSTTYVTSFLLESSSFSPIFTWDNSSAASSQSNTVLFSSMSQGNTLSSGLTSTFTLYPVSTFPDTIVSGEVCHYVVFFASGVFVEGTLTAQ